MKKSKYLSIIPLLAIVASTSSCSMPLVGESSNLSNVEDAINKVMAYDYSNEVKSISYYTVEKMREKFDVPQSIVDANPGVEFTNIGFRNTTRQRVTRIDFSDKNDLYFYDYSTYEYQYIYSIDANSAKVAAESNSYSWGMQFYKDNGKYHFEYSGIKGIGPFKSLMLDRYPYLITPEVERLNDVVSTSNGVLSMEDGTSLFNNYLVKIAEHDFRINSSIVEKYENDKTGGYKYTSDGISKFAIHESGLYDVNVLTPIQKEVDGKMVYDSFTGKVLYPELILKYYVDDNFNLSEKDVLSVQNKSWVNLESKPESKQKRSVNLNYTKGGWLESGSVSDDRTFFNTYELAEGSSGIVFDYYVHAEFNLKLPHVFGK